MNPTLKNLIATASILLATAAQAAFTPNAAGDEITDTTTGLTWKRCSEGQTWSAGTCTGTALTFTHEQALQRATTQAGAAGWRLPNIKELSSIVDAGSVGPAIDTAAFPATLSNSFWSSSPYAFYSDFAWFVSFGNGSVGGSYRSDTLHVRLVR